MRTALILISTCAILALIGASGAGARQSKSFFPSLVVTSDPFVIAGLDASSLHAWSGSPSPVLTLTATNAMPIAASFSLSGTPLTVLYADAYSRVGVIDSGKTLLFSGRLPAVSATASVTFSILDTKALAVNLLGGATPASTVNGLVSALQSGPGAVLAVELKHELKQALTGKESRIVLARNLSALMIKFGASREDRKWLLDNFAVDGGNVIKLATWAKDVAQSFGAYAGLTHAGIDGTETLTLSSASSNPPASTVASGSVSSIAQAALSSLRRGSGFPLPVISGLQFAETPYVSVTQGAYARDNDLGGAAWEPKPFEDGKQIGESGEWRIQIDVFKTPDAAATWRKSGHYLDDSVNGGCSARYSDKPLFTAPNVSAYFCPDYGGPAGELEADVEASYGLLGVDFNCAGTDFAQSVKFSKICFSAVQAKIHSVPALAAAAAVG